MSLLKAPQSTQPKKPQKRRASRPGPDVHTACQASGREAGQTPKTSRPPNQRTARPVASGRATVHTVHYFHSTAQPQVSHWSGTGLQLWLVFGGRVGGGGRPVTTALSVHKRLTRKRGGSSRDRIPKESETHHQPKVSETPESETRFEPEVRRSPKESVTPESATRDQPRSQSLLPNEPEAYRSSKPPDTVGNAERPKSRVFRRLQAQRGLLRQKVVFQPTGLRDPRKS